MVKRLVSWFEHIGRMRAASELARQGYYKEAKRLMCNQEVAKFVRILAVFLATTILISDDVGRGILDKKGKRKEEVNWWYTDEELDFINGN